MTDTQNGENILYAVICSSAAALGGLLFGYDIGVIAGAVPFITEHFHLNAHQEGFAVSNILIGCIIGSGLSGPFSDRYGRKKSPAFDRAVFRPLGGAIGCGHQLFRTDYRASPRRDRCRRIDDLGAVHFRDFPGPYARVPRFAQPVRHSDRHTYCLFHQLGVCGQRPQQLAVHVRERDYPGTAVLFQPLFYSESPRWLVKQKKNDTALRVLTKIMGQSGAETEMAAIANAIEHEKGSVMDLFRRGLRKALVIGVVISIFRAGGGIGAVIYYAPLIFMKADFPSTSSAFIATIAVGFVNFAFTIVSFVIIDRFGRKPLLYVGLVGMCAAMTVTGIAFITGMSNVYLIIPPILVFVGCYAMSLGPVAWVIVAEIFPTKIRGVAMSISMMVLWLADFTVSQTFPWLMDTLAAGLFSSTRASMCWDSFLSGSWCRKQKGNRWRR